jgi:OmpA-OmpF porin, OOP family
MKRELIVIAFVFCSVFCLAQNTEPAIFAEGKIVNAATKEAVTANLSYQSLPYASKVGALAGSTYSFPLYDKEKYAITVQAAGFQIFKMTVDPAAANAEGKVIKDIELVAEAAKPVEAAPVVGKVIPLNSVIFAKESYAISAAAHSQLNDVAKMLHESPNMIIQIEGHTDKDTNKDAARVNMRLSEDRVNAVKEYLVSKGVSKSKVKTKAFGGTKPIYTGSDVKQRALNRRVEARILEN